jgi:cyclopropane fatty-acyl-phospholipid synthase-like methyltransferase
LAWTTDRNTYVIVLVLSEACERNKDPILSNLREHFAAISYVLEIGSGTGQHAVYFGEQLPHLVWQISDVAENLAGISQRLEQDGPANVITPIALNVEDDPWPVDSAEAIFSANSLHIMSWEQVEHFFRGVGAVLHSGGPLCVYGPFRYGTLYTSDSNAAFDRHLKARDPFSGIRDFEAVDRLAKAQGLRLDADHAMPANNQMLVWRRS